MTLSDLCNREELMSIREHIANRELFEHRKAAKGQGWRVELRILSNFIPQDLANQLWSGRNYLVHVDVDYNSPEGIGGGGYASDTFERFETWERFEQSMEGRLLQFPFYERERDDQLSLF